MKIFSIAFTALLLFTAVARAELAVPYEGPWTEDELRRFCIYKAYTNYKNKNYYDACMKRNITIVGKPKNQAALNYFNYIYWHEEALKSGGELRTK